MNSKINKGKNPPKTYLKNKSHLTQILNDIPCHQPIDKDWKSTKLTILQFFHPLYKNTNPPTLFIKKNPPMSHTLMHLTTQFPLHHKKGKPKSLMSQWAISSDWKTQWKIWTTPNKNSFHQREKKSSIQGKNPTANTIHHKIFS